MNFEGGGRTKRIVTLMAPSQKLQLRTKAQQAGVTVSEFVRRSLDAYDPDEQRQLEIFAAAFRQSAKRVFGYIGSNDIGCCSDAGRRRQAV